MILETFPVGPLRCNCTILGDEVTHEAMVVDPGDNIPEILSRLQKHGLTLRQIVVTHAHIDHVGGAAQLRKLTGAPVVMNQQDLKLLGMMEMQAGWLGVPTPQVAGPGVAHSRTHSREHLPPLPRSAFVACGRHLVCRIDRENRSPRGRWAANPAFAA
jgi:glyoxylase-like metal-dependent hydrolase (beta-lactamase superfamily II)